MTPMLVLAVGTGPMGWAHDSVSEFFRQIFSFKILAVGWQRHHELLASQARLVYPSVANGS